MKGPSLAEAHGYGEPDGEEEDGEAEDTDKAEQDAYDAFVEAIKGDDREAGRMALKTFLKLCYESEEEQEGEGEKGEEP